MAIQTLTLNQNAPATRAVEITRSVIAGSSGYAGRQTHETGIARGIGNRGNGDAVGADEVQDHNSLLIHLNRFVF